MIKLERGKRPEELTEEIKIKLREKYKKNKKESVWNKPYIKKALLEMSHGKCCYCETKLTEESKYMTVDHYHPKSKYPDEVIDWENLLPMCSRCNSKKREHDTYINPIINPTEDDPKEYLYIEKYRYKSKNRNQKGQMTVDVMYLNDSTASVPARFSIGEATQEKILRIYELTEKYENDNSDVRERNKIIFGIKGLLKTACPKKEYSALVSTVILEDENYNEVKSRMKQYGIWDEELEELERIIKKISLSKDGII